YFRYIHNNREIIARNKNNENLFRSIAGSSINQYYGFAFERLGEAALDTILDQLDLNLTDIVKMGSYFRQTRTHGAGLQIDWLVIRRDGVWSLLEFKYLNKPAGMQVMHDIKQKIDRLNAPDNITIEPVLISAHGATKQLEQTQFFQKIINLSDLVNT
ncbi:MAG: hypothetical protein DRI57_31505, partial [Deltaproteobacteria bacterium]